VTEAPEGEASPQPDPGIWQAFDSYLSARVAAGDEVLDAVLAASAAAGLPQVNVTANQGAFLALLLRVSGARRVLEIGTLAGYSTIWLARALPPGGRLVSLELSALHCRVARENVARAGLDDVVDVRLGPALESLATIERTGEDPFDAAFIDVDEAGNAELFPLVKGLVRPAGLVIVGAADLIRGTRRLFAEIARHPDVSLTAVQTVGSQGHDGFVIALVGGGR